MENHESAPLLDHVTRSLRCRQFLLIPVAFLLVFSTGLSTYMLPQYVHLMVEQTVPNLSGNQSTVPNLSGNQSTVPNLPGNQSTGTGSESEYVYNPCSYSEADPKYERYIEIQQHTAEWTMFFSIATLVPAIFTSILWGALSDIHGRKMALIIIIGGRSIKFIITAIVVYFDLNLAYVIVASFIDGCSGSETALYAVCMSYISDLTESGKQRTRVIVLSQVCIVTLAYTVATFGSGYFIEFAGYFYPALMITCLTIIALAIIIVLLPETLPAHARACANQTTLRNTINTIKSVGQFYLKQEKRDTQMKYICLMLCFAFFSMTFFSTAVMEPIYQMGVPFCWQPSTIGQFAGLKLGIGSLLSVTGTYALQKCCADDTVATVGLLSLIFAQIVEGLAESGAVLFTIPVIGAFGLLPMPMIRSLMSQLTDSRKQGALFAGLAAVETLCTLIGSLTSNLVYSATVAIFNGFVFILGALIVALSLVFLLCFMYIKRREPKPDTLGIRNLIRTSVDT